jgi:sec-independent protein translocase protein TatA
MFGLRPVELLLILAVVIVLFGAKRLPQLGSAIGESLKGFKKSMREVNEEDQAAAAKSLPRNETASQSTASNTSANANAK